MTVLGIEVVVPELGQVVRCRDRVRAVSEVAPSALPPDPIGGTRPQHLVRMSSIEDDGFGDELTVIWELEAGTQVIPHRELPRPEPGRLDSPGRLDAFLDAVRWGAVATADSRALQAPFRSGITIEDYQLDPVVRALAMPRANLLIAHDVGLARRSRPAWWSRSCCCGIARTVLVVCPAGLCVKWQEEMLGRFGVEFRIVNTDAVRQLRRDRGVGANVFASFPRLIVSIDWLKDSRAQSLLDEVLAGADHRRTPRKFDLLIVDVVHSIAPRYADEDEHEVRPRRLKEAGSKVTPPGCKPTIVCVVANASIDRLLEVETLTPGGIHRPRRVTPVAGGKGLNVARAAGALGGEVRVAALLGGHAGRWVAEQLADHGIDACVVWCSHETRTCASVFSDADGLLTEFYEPGQPVLPDEWASLEHTVGQMCGPNAIVTLSGSLPPGVAADGWARLTRVALQAGATVMADTYGQPLLATLAERTALVKINAAEASTVTGIAVHDTASALTAGRVLLSAGARAAIITLGADGAIGVDGSDSYVCGVGPRGKYPVGSGDAYLAGVAVGFQRGQHLPDAMRLGAAAAAANAAVPGAGILDSGVWHKSLQQVTLQHA